MDIDYLLLLQRFHEATGNALSPLMLQVSDLAIGFIPIAAMCLVYWVFDRAAGKRILAGFSLGLFLNGFLKLLCCVYRPWIRDSRVLPYGDSKVTATGHSFPSGHSTFATETDLAGYIPPDQSYMRHYRMRGRRYVVCARS